MRYSLDPGRHSLLLPLALTLASTPTLTLTLSLPLALVLTLTVNLPFRAGRKGPHGRRLRHSLDPRRHSVLLPTAAVAPAPSVLLHGTGKQPPNPNTP